MSINTAPDAAPDTAPDTTPAPTPRARFTLPVPALLRRHNTQLWIGVGIVGLIALTVFIGPLFLTQSPTDQDLANAFASGSAEHPLGTDHLGRDILARLLYGGRNDLTIAVIAVIVPLAAGSCLGVLAGYHGRWVDAVIMRCADLVSAFPFYVLVISLVFVLGNGARSIFIAISVVSWVAYARIVRGEVLVLKEKDFIASSQSSGLPASLILTRHVVPNSIGQAVIYAMSDIVLNIGVIVTLSYFGMGIVPPTPDWGQMMSDGQDYLAAGHYALTLLPGSCVVLLSLGLALIGDGLTEKLKGQ